MTKEEMIELFETCESTEIDENNSNNILVDNEEIVEINYSSDQLANSSRFAYMESEEYFETWGDIDYDYKRRKRINPIIVAKVDELLISADINAAKGDNSGAIDDYNKAQELDPDNAVIFACRGCFYLGIQYFKEAVLDFTISLSLNLDRWIFYFLATAYMQLKDYENAAINYWKVMRYNRGDLRTLKEYADALFLSGDYELALKKYNEFYGYVDDDGYEEFFA